MRDEFPFLPTETTRDAPKGSRRQRAPLVPQDHKYPQAGQMHTISQQTSAEA